MSRFGRKVTDNWQDIVCLVLGVWLVASPWVLGFTAIQAATWNAVILGFVIVLMSAAELVKFHDWEEWTDVLVGGWLAISPWVLGFPAEAGGTALFTANFVVVGLLVLAMAAWSMIHHHDGAHA